MDPTRARIAIAMQTVRKPEEPLHGHLTSQAGTSIRELLFHRRVNEPLPMLPSALRWRDRLQSNCAQAELLHSQRDYEASHARPRATARAPGLLQEQRVRRVRRLHRAKAPPLPFHSSGAARI